MEMGIQLARTASDLPISDSGTPADLARPEGKTGRTYLQTLTEERKARLARLGEPPRYQAKLPAPKPKRALPLVIPVNAALYYHEMWFWDLVAHRDKPYISPSNPDCSDLALPRAAPEFKRIVNLVCEHYDVAKVHLLSEGRDAKITLARQVIMYLARNMTPLTFPAIGRKLRRDHTSVIHGFRKIERLMQTDAELRRQVHSFQRALR